MDDRNRPYLPKWEKRFPWLTKKVEDGRDIASCKWCNVDLGLFTTRFKDHGNSLKHRKNDPNGSYQQALEKTKENEKNSKEPDPMTDVPTIFDIPLATGIMISDDMSQVTEAADDGKGVVTTESVQHPPISVDFSLPVSNEVLEMLGVAANPAAAQHHPQDQHQEHQMLQDASHVPVQSEMTAIISMCTLKANAQHPVWLNEHLAFMLHTGYAFDVIWLCAGGGVFRAHKLVLSALSEHMKSILPDNDSIATIFTPELSSDAVAAILSLFYTGEAKVSGALLKEINNDFLTIGFYGKDLTAIPSDEKKPTKEEFAYSTDIFDPLLLDHNLLEILDPSGKLRNKTKTDKVESVPTAAPHQMIKVELEEEEDEVNYAAADDDVDYYPEEDISSPPPTPPTQPRKRIKLEENKKANPRFLKRTLDVMRDKFKVTEDKDIVREDDAEDRKRFRADHKDSKTAYSLRNKNVPRGFLSKMLPYDLFDDRQVAEKAKVIVVCPICFKCFDDKDKMKDHRMAFHDMEFYDSRKKANSMIIGKDEYKCKKCEETLVLKHLVWFVKHYKFCGIDNEKANQLLKPEDVEEMYVEEKEKDSTKDSTVLVIQDTIRHKDICRVLLGKETWDFIHGCKKCYEPFGTEVELKRHIDTAHEGKDEHGTLYYEQTRTYNCQRCKVQSRKNLIHFIYHLKSCTVVDDNPGGGVPIDDEEDVDEDTNEDFVDPWGIVYKPLKVRNERSKWICEALFGEILPILYPCHICYQVFKMEEGLRDHFRKSHPGMQNFLELGPHYNKEQFGFDCPVCKRNVCKKERNSIYFSYHIQKCRNQLHTVNRTCPNCNKEFNNLRAYQLHLQSKCDTVSFVCHICGMALKSAQNLRNHVKLTHTNVRKYKCNVCDAAYKREFDLKHHMRIHIGSLDFSCEKCGKAFPVKKALSRHMKTHYTEAEKRYACHVCGYRFSNKHFLDNHLTTHSEFRGFACEACNAKLKTRDNLKQHRKKVHNLTTRIPDSCILKPNDAELMQATLVTAGGGVTSNKTKRGGRGAAAAIKKQLQAAAGGNAPVTLQIKEEVLPLLEDELQLP